MLTPQGTSAEAFKLAGFSVLKTSGLSQFDNTRFGHYRRLRWFILARELYFFLFTILAVWKIKRLNIDFKLIHVNEITLLPTAIIAKLILKLPVVTHVRSLQFNNRNSFRSRYCFKLLSKYSDAVICIDETVKQTIPEYVSSYVVHNGIYLSEPDFKKQQVASPNESLRVGMAGVFLRSKGIYEFIEAARILLIERRRNIKFVLAGENARETKGFLKWLYEKLGFSSDVYSDVKKYIFDNKIEDQVELLGLIKDIRPFYKTIDVLCFPSYLNACGRPVFEAALNGIPSIVAIKNPLRDAIIHEVTGLAIDKPDPKLLADAIEVLLNDQRFRIQLGNQAKQWAKKIYRIDLNADLVIKIYESIKNS